MLREDSDDELGIEDHPWEWIYGSVNRAEDAGDFTLPPDFTINNEKTIVGARMGNFECRLGDTVLLKAMANEAWVAIITGFSEGEIEDDDGGMIWSKNATFMWFSSEKEIKNSPKKRDDSLPVSLPSQCAKGMTGEAHGIPE